MSKGTLKMYQLDLSFLSERASCASESSPAMSVIVIWFIFDVDGVNCMGTPRIRWIHRPWCVIIVGNAHLHTHKENWHRNSLCNSKWMRIWQPNQQKNQHEALHKALQHNHQPLQMQNQQTYTLWTERVARQMLSGLILSISIWEG